MKILHIDMGHPEHPVFYGGAEIRNRKIYECLSTKGHHITILSSKIGSNKYIRINDNLEYVFIGRLCKNTTSSKILCSMAFSFDALIWILRHYKEFNVIIEELCPWSPSFAFILESKKPVALQIQGYAPYSILAGKSGRFIGSILYMSSIVYPKFFKRWIVLSDVLNDRYNILGKVVSQGVDDYLLNGSKQGIGGYVGFMGRFDLKQKGIDLLLDAIEVLKKDGMVIKFALAGDGHDKAEIIRMIKDKDIHDLVDLVGWVDGQDKLRFLNNARLMVFPSRYEGQSIAVMEAAACYKPVIVSSIPELSYAVANGFGIRFDDFDKHSLANCIKSLYFDCARILEMGDRARSFAVNHSWRSIAEKYEEILRKWTAAEKENICL
ncbi:MAG: glycosyltransferase family 4 protein [Nitrososphaerota archaeon]